MWLSLPLITVDKWVWGTFLLELLVMTCFSYIDICVPKFIDYRCTDLVTNLLWKAPDGFIHHTVVLGKWYKGPGLQCGCRR